jgi:hypothetical protein
LASPGGIANELDVRTLQSSCTWGIVQPNEAASAAATLEKTLAELSKEELRESPPESSGHSDRAREAARQAVQLGPLKIMRYPTLNRRHQAGLFLVVVAAGVSLFL